MADQDVLFRVGVVDHPDTAKRLKGLSGQVRATVEEINSSMRSIEAVNVRVSQSDIQKAVEQINRSMRDIEPVNVRVTQTITSDYQAQLGEINRINPSAIGPRSSIPPAAAPKAAPTPAPVSVPAPPPTPPPVAPSGSDDLEKVIDSLKEYERLGAESEKITEKMGSSFREFTGKVGETAEGLGRMAQGLAFLGAKNDDVKKVVDTLLTVKGTVDVFVGVSKTITGTIQVFSLFSERQKAAARQQEISAQQQEIARQAAVKYVAVLEKEGVTIDQLARDNRELADALRQVTAQTKAATAAESARDAAASVPPIPSGRGGVRGRGRGIAAGVAGAVGTEALSSFGGGGLTQTIGSIGIDLLMQRLLGGGAVAAAGTGAATTAVGTGAAAAGTGAAAGAGAAGAGAGAGAAGLAGLAGGAVAAAALAGALGALTLVTVELVEVFSGTSNKVGSVTDTIATWEVSMVDWLGDMTGLFDIVKGSEQAAKADEALKKRKENEDIKKLQNESGSNQRAMDRRAEQSLADKQRENESGLRGVMGETGADRLSGLKLQRQNLMRELAGQQALSQLGANDGTFAGQQRSANSAEQLRRLQDQLRNTDAQIAGVQSAGGSTTKEQLEKERLGLAKELEGVMSSIAGIEKDAEANYAEYVQQLDRATALGQKMEENEKAVLAAIRMEKDERVKANQVAIDGANARLSAIQKERDAAQATLKSGAERFAAMNEGDKMEAIQAMQMADAGNANRLTDKQRSLLRSIGTQRATQAAEQADMAEAQKGGFFRTFGREEQQKVSQAATEERKLKVEIGNLQEVNVKIEADYERLAAATIPKIQALINQRMQAFEKRLETVLNKDKSTASQSAQQEMQRLQATKNA